MHITHWSMLAYVKIIWRTNDVSQHTSSCLLDFTISLTRGLYYFNDIRHYDSEKVRIWLCDLQCSKNLDNEAQHPVLFTASHGCTRGKH